MAKRQKKQPAKLTRKQISRIEKERRQMRFIRIGGLVLLIIVLLLLGAGLFKTHVADPAATRSAEEALNFIPAVTVNGTMVSITDWQARVRFERQMHINQIAQISQQLSFFDPSTEFGQQLISQGQAQIQEIRDLLDLGDGIAADVLDQMVEEQLIRQEAARRGIVVTPEELQTYIEVNLFSYPYPPTPEPIPTLPPPTLAPTATVTPEPMLTPTTAPTPRSLQDYEADYGTYIEQVQEITGMTEKMWRAMVEGELYREKLFDAFGAEVDPNVLQAKGRYIIAQDLSAAETLLGRLNTGETFEALAQEIQADDSEEPTARTGTFDWSPTTVLSQRFGNEFATVVMNTDPGNYSRTAIATPDGGLYIVFVDEREVRELAESLLDQQRLDEFQGWLEEQKVGDGILYGNWREYIPREPSL
jgi:parvulin-like peptidyl-prolyl isomerase